MALRNGHGRAGALAPGPRVEVLPPDEQPQAQAGAAVSINAGRDPTTGRLRSSEAARALAKLPRKSRFLPKKIATDPRFAAHNNRRLEWQKRRLAELGAAHGGVGHGVGAMINAAAWLYSGAEFASEQAAETGDVELFKIAATLTSTARQHDLAAWELSAREAAARPKPAAARFPWLAAASAPIETTTSAPTKADASEGQPDRRNGQAQNSNSNGLITDSHILERPGDDS